MKVGMFGKGGGNKRAYVSARKPKWTIYRPLPSVIPTLHIGDHVVELVFEFKCVGIWFTSIHKNIFYRHYDIKASKARGTSNVIFGLKHRIGSLPVREGLQLYMARVDCYLISGCELALDTDTSLLDDLMEVQHSFLRRLLGLNSHSMLAVLFTETGQMPIRIRRLLLALGRLQYLLEFDDRRVARSALLDSIALLCEGKSGWATDLAILLRHLPTAVAVTPDDLLCSKTFEGLAQKIVGIVDEDLQRDIDRLVKTHLLCNCLETGEGRAFRLVTRCLRHYLVDVAVPAHCKAITGLLLGDHNLTAKTLGCRNALITGALPVPPVPPTSTPSPPGPPVPPTKSCVGVFVKFGPFTVTAFTTHTSFGSSRPTGSSYRVAKSSSTRGILTCNVAQLDLCYNVRITIHRNIQNL
ncbi:Reverse transcriptase domain-containing protein [Mycena venus]|uniref:Reverse transcriptase domain-containing protein n=1 Tax=Mycena venus TaxID=2733690 RepID=A0A8H7CP77_9AGAR|nr:Reverse transcriptase domain-containing protein [Mycena venus]